jgi:transcription initiation factor IIE alpha subunit
MAKIKIKFGENELEIESRDFYIDNASLGEVIANVSKYIQENNAQVVFEHEPIENIGRNSDIYEATKNTLATLEEAEIHEPEFSDPISIPSSEINNKLKILEKNSFFNLQRTVSETVEQLREYGWRANSLDVSKALTKMAINKEILKNSNKKKTFYSSKHALIVN